MTELSVLVVNWNTRDLVLECVAYAEEALRDCASVAAAGGAELVVIDNGSVDGSADAVSERHPEVEVLRLPRNVGYAAGNNAGIERCKGRWLLLLNTDVRLEAASVERVLEYGRAHADAGILGAQLVHEDGRLQNSVHAFPSLATELLPIALLELAWPARYPSKRHRCDDPIEVEAVHGAALFVRRELIDEVGPLPEEYFFFLEETEWCWRARAAGWKVVHVPGTRLVHASGSSSKRPHPGATAIEYHRSLYRFLRARRGAVVERCARALRMLRSLGSVVLNALPAVGSTRARQRLSSRWSVLRWHLRGCPQGEGLAAVAQQARSPDA